MVRLAAGRKQMTREAILLCFLAGANSIFSGEKLLTTPNPAPDEDADLLNELGLKPMGFKEKTFKENTPKRTEQLVHAE
jgi:biotin synthase